MTERKPRQQSFTSWIDQQIADAEKRGVFDNLPGAGQPLNIKPTGDGDFGQAWVRDYARREGVSPDEFLPTPLKLRREIERLAETVGEMRSEAEVRETFGELNRRIIEWRRIPVGPPIHVRLVNTDEMVARWRAAQAAKATQAGKRAQPTAEDPTLPRKARPVRRDSWLRRLRRNKPAKGADNSKKR
jgi:DnaJ homologue, subfamily C, member 28, conserved domain